jgi:ADP-dependent NAD(P)H-hydrate dehydratase / NAD(P)H-hydrate epimerase
VAKAAPSLLGERELVIDALFGAGLARPLEGMARALVEAIGERHLDCLAVDVPSGLDADSGEVLGAAPTAKLTVTFGRAKPGHYLLPGRSLCGELVVADIGIPDSVVEGIGPRLWLNGPWLWGGDLTPPRPEDHKYSRGHVLILAGGRMTGAGRLAARGARRAGAGMVTLLAPAPALPIYAGDQPGLLTSPISELERYLGDRRISAVLIGPGAGRGAATRRHVLQVLESGKPAVLDADALTVFAEAPNELFEPIRGPTLFTPHAGEFARLFPTAGNKLSRARDAARTSGASVLFKGNDTVLAAPDGRAIINANAPATLATAGAGDVLAGIILALMGQEIAPFEAGAAGIWLHGAAAAARGPGLIAEDLPDSLPSVLRPLFEGPCD